MDEDLEAVRAEAFEYRKRVTEENELVGARFGTSVERPKRQVSRWNNGEPRTLQDGRVFRRMRKSINEAQTNYVNENRAATKIDSQLISDLLESDLRGSDEKLKNARVGMERNLRRLNTDLPRLKSLMSDLEHLLDELDAFVDARTTAAVPHASPVDDLEPQSHATDTEAEPPIRNPLSSLILQMADPANQKDFELTPKLKEAVKNSLVLMQEIQSELEDQGRRLERARERWTSRYERWVSIGPHDVEREHHLTAMLQRITALYKEYTAWHGQWNASASKAAQDAVESRLSGEASRISMVMRLHDILRQLKNDQFPTGTSLVWRIETKSSDIADYIDENLLKKPTKPHRRIWSR
jgi:hypothetical protein